MHVSSQIAVLGFIGATALATISGSDAFAQTANAGMSREALMQQAAAQPTPRTAAGKPDLSGYWNGTLGRGGNPFAPAPPGERAEGDVLVELPARDGDVGLFELDQYVVSRTSDHLPLYKPKYWEFIRELDRAGIEQDPAFHCQPPGVPRMGAPVRIVQLEDEVILFYTTLYNVYRTVPMDGRPHDAEHLLTGTWMGDPVGSWDGDTLVIESTAFNDQTWFGGEMPFVHGWDMKVTESLRREGNILHWDAIVEDPQYLAEPYHVEGEMRFLNTDAHPIIREVPACLERDSGNITLNIR